jgi:hypothetical protein
LRTENFGGKREAPRSGDVHLVASANLVGGHRPPCTTALSTNTIPVYLDESPQITPMILSSSIRLL